MSKDEALRRRIQARIRYKPFVPMLGKVHELKHEEGQCYIFTITSPRFRENGTRDCRPVARPAHP